MREHNLDIDFLVYGAIVVGLIILAILATVTIS